ncbi:MAG TPA: polysaccharide deacetylase family protein [Thermodesulfobacteriota bacterium]|nr:polysaccharide deacetylase family protein [Thermodesulfobacteriota bacterium]
MNLQSSSGDFHPSPLPGANLLTFDIEDWYHINYPAVDFSLFDQQENHQELLEHTRQLVGCCRQRGLRATFFVLGRLLEKKPEIGHCIIEGGQELGLHGYEHELLTDQTPDRFKTEMERSLKAFHQITGDFPLGFRAPSWSVDEKNFWILEILESFGFAYDSSIFPLKNFLYGIAGAPMEPFYPVVRGRTLKLLEIPVTVFRLGSRRLAFSGGIYFNLWPFQAVRKMSEKQNRLGQSTLFYFHPWDLWKRPRESRRRLKAHWTSLHLGTPLKKFRLLLEAFPLAGIGDRMDQLKATARSIPLGKSHEI